MKIKVLAIGKTDDKCLNELIGQYEKRLKHYIPFELDIIPDLKQVKNMSMTEQKSKEGQLFLKKLKPTDFIVLLDEKGKDFRSIEFADYLQKRMNSGIKQLVLLIGGPYGFSPEIYEKAQGKISLSKMTFSHQMIRLFIIEQIYRSFTILKNEPYHHE
ncbi:MAG: 23S rRNA (pseudouridine(1915)-N(3))-methyltransferase RlmH [Flavobacteriaceae bacterium]